MNSTMTLSSFTCSLEQKEISRHTFSRDCSASDPRRIRPFPHRFLTAHQYPSRTSGLLASPDEAQVRPLPFFDRLPPSECSDALRETPASLPSRELPSLAWAPHTLSARAGSSRNFIHPLGTPLPGRGCGVSFSFGGTP